MSALVGYVVGRMFQAAITLLILSAVVFAMSRASGDPRDLMLSQRATREEYDELGRALGLDQPVTVQYWRFISSAARGDLGLSLRTQEPVMELVADRLTATLQLVAIAMLLAFVLGIPLGIAASHYGGAIDGAISGFSLLAQSFPAFWVGLVLIEIFAARLSWLPAGGFGGPSSVVLPAATLAVFGVAVVVGVLRSEMARIMRTEYIKLARATGISEVAVLWKHAFRNALLPLVSFASVLFVIMVTTLGTVVETLFAWPGIGQLTFSAILNRDFPVVQGVVLVAGALAIGASLLADIVYARVDPRVRFDARV